MEVEDKTMPRPIMCARTVMRGIGQVMFQENAWTGLLFLAGIFWGSYASGLPAVAWGALVGCVASTIAGRVMGQNIDDGKQGLWGFNGTLVGCAFGTFMANTWLMWISMIVCAAMTTWVRRGFNNVMANWKVNSLTFPFVFMTWIFLLAARITHGLDPVGLSTPELPAGFDYTLDLSFGSLVVYWLKGISQVFLVNSWVTGIFFLVSLFVASRWACLWAAVGSAISLALALLYHANPADIQNGLFGFSPVLTAIALGMTFYKPNWKSALWTIAGIVATFFVQAAMDVFLAPVGIPTLTGPFCIATWLFLLPLYKLDVKEKPNHSGWNKNNNK